MTKPFKTINEQMDILRSRGLDVPESAYNILLSENYYSVINGYKDSFIDKNKSTASSEEVYIKGASFDDVYDLFVFDRELREHTFHYLLKAEALIKTVSVYTFCENFPDPDSYLDTENYTSRSEYMLGRKRHIEDLPDLVSTLRYKAYTSDKCKDFIEHYRTNHGDVPLWVLANDLTFGNVSYFYNLQKRSIQNAICRRIVELRESDSKKTLTPKRMRMILRTLVPFRNICAHDERLYCAQEGPVKDITFVTMMEALEEVLPDKTMTSFYKGVVEILKRHKNLSTLVEPISNAASE